MWGVVCLGDEFGDLAFVDVGLWSWNTLDAEGGIEGAPGLDEATKGVVWCEICVYDGLVCDGACSVLA